MTTTHYLVTDPCYTIKDHQQWVATLDEFGYDEWVGERIKCDIGTIIEASSTENGDGYVKLGNGKEVNADAGMTCIVEITDMSLYDANRHGNAITKSLETAQRWFEKARTI